MTFFEGSDGIALNADLKGLSKMVQPFKGLLAVSPLPESIGRLLEKSGW